MVGELIKKALRGQEAPAEDPWKVKAQKFKMGLINDIVCDTVYIWMPNPGYHSGAKMSIGDVVMDISGFIFADSDVGMDHLSIDGYRGPGIAVHPRGNQHIYRVPIAKTNYNKGVHDDQGIVIMDQLASIDWGL